MTFLSSVVYAQLIPATPPNPKHQEFYDILHQVQQHIDNDEHPLAILRLVYLLNILKNDQKQKVASFFPESFGGFEVSVSDYPVGADFQVDSTSVLFSQHYQDEQGFNIDVNIVFLDPSISEYINIIEKPQLLDNLENTKLVKLKEKYWALEKFSDESKYYERNIVLSKNTLLNVIANGVDDKEILDTFCSRIDIEKIDDYLSK